MKSDARPPSGPRGGLQVQTNVVRRWRWGPKGELLSAPVRCKREQWYLARGFSDNCSAGAPADLLLNFLRDDQVIAKRRILLDAVAEARPGEALLGWVQAPADATHLQIRLPEPDQGSHLNQLLLHPVAERDPKCHPLANVPRWSSFRPPFPLDRVVLPTALEPLAALLKGVEVELLGSPRSLRKLAATVIGAACVIDPAWLNALKLELRDLERVAAASWMIVDLESFLALLNRGGVTRTKIITHVSEHDIMSARVEYADIPTRGFALQDVLPFATFATETAFRTRVLQASPAWRRYADETGFATLLASETPWEAKCGDVLSAARPIDQGELIVTDLPWLVAGRQGRLLAPRLAEHLLRMHLGLPLADSVQYWNRWDDCRVLVRDIGDLPRHYPPLRAVRWASDQSGVARLGITLPNAGNHGKRRHLMFCTGRIDQLSSHDGVPAEPMVIFMKWLVREFREGTRWAARHLEGTAVTWQFDTADGLKYALHFDSATGVAADKPASTLIVKTGDAEKKGRPAPHGKDSVQVMTVPIGAGIFGDRALEAQADLTARLRGWIERAGRRDA